MFMHIKVLLCCAILSTSYLDDNDSLKKLKKAIQMILKQIMIKKDYLL